MHSLLRTLSVACILSVVAGVNRTSIQEAREYLQYLDKESCEYNHRVQVASWNYETNITEDNYSKMLEALSTSDKIVTEIYYWRKLNDSDALRQASLYGLLSPSQDYEKSDETKSELNEVIGEMVNFYLNQTICKYTNRSQCDIPSQPTVDVMLRTSTDVDELQYYWLTYQNKISEDIKPLFTKYIDLGNKYAQYYYYTNKAEQWLDYYESPSSDKFEQVILDLYEQFKPLYLQLHAFVRKRLHEYYGPCAIDRTGPIPIHLTGSVNAETFVPIYDKVKPYPEKESTDVTPQMIKQNYTVRKLAEICDDFYTSLGLTPMPETFWNLSLFEKPTDRESTCFWAEWDMYDKKDYRVLVCARPKMSHWLALCHEMGHLEYAIGYKDQPCCYRKASSVVNEAWADVAGISLVTTERLAKLGLLESSTVTDHELEINQLFLTALDKIAFMPDSMLVDLWRWRYFRGEFNESSANKAWWDIRLQYQGIEPPEPRPDDGLDPASKSHIINDSQYIMYFMANIIQFQMQESLCKAAGKYDPSDPASPPLSKCDIYGSKESGQLIKNMFSLGYSKPWPEVLKEITGSSKIDAQPMLNYFKVLYDWLQEDNKKTGEVIGW